MIKMILILAPATVVGFASPTVAAGPYRHHHHAMAIARDHVRAPVSHTSQETLGSGYDNPYAHYYGPGSAVLNATQRSRSEPGVTLELSPDAKETATGGPVGGPPGFDGS